MISLDIISQHKNTKNKIRNKDKDGHCFEISQITEEELKQINEANKNYKDHDKNKNFADTEENRKWLEARNRVKFSEAYYNAKCDTKNPKFKIGLNDPKTLDMAKEIQSAKVVFSKVCSTC